MYMGREVSSFLIYGYFGLYIVMVEEYGVVLGCFF